MREKNEYSREKEGARVADRWHVLCTPNAVTSALIMAAYVCSERVKCFRARASLSVRFHAVFAPLRPPPADIRQQSSGLIHLRAIFVHVRQ